LVLPTGRVVSSKSELGNPGEVAETGRVVLALSSFLGGVGPWSVDIEEEVAGVGSAPRGPSGSKASSTASSFVGWTSILRAGIFLDAEDRGPLEAGFAAVVEPEGSINKHIMIGTLSVSRTCETIVLGRAGD